MGRGGNMVARKEALRPKQFFRSDEAEPHGVRKAAILKAHPEVRELMGPEWRTKYIVLATVALQTYLATAPWVARLGWGSFLALVCVVVE